jgi:hypothetical protein
MKPVSAWTTNVKTELANAHSLFTKKLETYSFHACVSANSFWLVAESADNTRIAFRCAFSVLNEFEVIGSEEVDGIVVVQLKTDLGKYKVRIEFPKSKGTVFHYTTTFTGERPFLLPFTPRDIVPLVKDGLIENATGKIYLHQVGSRSGQLYFSLTKPKGGSVFYFQNLSSLNDYCDETITTVAESVGGEWPEIGFRLPPTEKNPVPAGKELTLSDAWVVLDSSIPKDEFEISQQFFGYLAEIYLLFKKPKVNYTDWIEIAEKGLHDLTHNKGCWLHNNGKSYLNAYVSDYKTPPESMVQLAVLMPLLEYEEWLGEKVEITKELISGLPDFYDNELCTMDRWLPGLTDNLDKSEEQKKEDIMDSWYLYHSLMNLARLARKGNKEAEKLVLDSVDFAVNVAHTFGYQWPVFYKMSTLEVVKAETEPGKGGEKDVPGLYIQFMLEMWQLTGEKRYLNESVKAAKQLIGLGFDLFYQANNTAFSAGALLRLYKETKDEQYLALSYCCLAGIFKNVQLWECGYGNSKHLTHFFRIFPLNNAPYTAAYEEFEVYTAILDYLKEAEGLTILPALDLLLPELVKYAVHRLSDYYPPMLPGELFAEEVKMGEVNPNLWIPLEDLYDGWDKNGQVGQEVYGTGLAFGIVPRQYYKVSGTGITVFIDYPVTSFRKYKNTLTIKVKGVKEMTCHMKIILSEDLDIRVSEISDKKITEIEPFLKTGRVFRITGNSVIRLEW